MNWSSLKKWAKEKGYTTFREKTTDVNNPNQYDYYWAKDDDPTATGVSISVSKLAKDIFNHTTDNKYLEYQKNYKPERNIDYGKLSGGW